MAHTHSILKLFNIKDKHIHFPEDWIQPDVKKGDITYKQLKATLTYPPKACTKCGCHNSHGQVMKYGFITTTLKFANIAFQPTLLTLKKQRFLCKECDATFVAETSLVQRHCQISNLIVQQIALELQKEQSMTTIAKRLGVSVTTVIRVLLRTAAALNPTRQHLPTVLCIDEFKSVKHVSGAMSFLFIDGDTHRLIDIVENRQQHYLMSYFQRYPLEARRQVKWVVMDMYSPYIHLVQSCFPSARIVMDKFHVVQHLNRALNRIRIDTMNFLRYRSPTDYRKLKKLWKLVLKNRESLNFDTYKSHRLFEGLVTEKSMVNYLVGLDPQLSQAYELINDLKYDIECCDGAGFALDLERTKLTSVKRYIRTTFQTLNRYLEPIQDALQLGYTNGPIEGLNNKIKNIKRSGYGYRNFDHLRARILITQTLTQSPLKRHSTVA